MWALALALATFLVLHTPHRASASAAAPPHLVFILADDLGFNDVGFTKPLGAEPEALTPFMDALVAKEGRLLTHHYVYRLCAPTRAMLMTGRYPGHGIWQQLPGFTGEQGLNLSLPLIPGVLKQAPVQYSTHQVGKWHLGFYRPEYLPCSRGFDTSFGYLSGAEDHFTQRGDNDCRAPQYKGLAGVDYWDGAKGCPAFGRNGTYNAYNFNAEAVGIIHTHAAENEKAGTPLFLYLALQNTHDPIQAEPRFEALYPHVEFQARQTYLAMASAVDEVVANVTGALKETGLWETTLLVFSSDNGAPGSGSNFPLRGYKLSNFEGGTRTPAFVSGGLLPAAVRGKPADGLAGIYDWSATFYALAGAKVPPSGIDGLDLWPWLSGEAAESPRKEVAYMLGGRGAMRDEQYKIIVGRCCPEGYPGLCQRGGPQSPNASTHMNTTDTACTEGPCVFDLKNDPREEHNINATQPDVTARLMRRFQELSLLASQTGTDVLLPTVPATTKRSSWGSTLVETDTYGACDKMAENGGFFGPWLGSACTDPSGFCGLAGKACATPSGGGLGSNPTEPYFVSPKGSPMELSACMAKCTADHGAGAAAACSCFDWNSAGSCRLHNTTWEMVSYSASRAANYSAFTRATDPSK